MKPAKTRKPRSQHQRKEFTPLWLPRLKPPRKGQELYWDTGQTGLALLASSGGTKTFRSQYCLNGKWQARSLKRLGELVSDDDLVKEYGPDKVEKMSAKQLGLAKTGLEIQKARAIVANDRICAEQGIDPKERQDQLPTARTAYEAVVDQFVELYAKPRQRTWEQTQNVLKRNCKPWLKKQFSAITKRDAYNLLEAFIAEGHGPKAGLTLAWLKTLWRWAYKRDLVASPVMDAVEIHFEKGKRDRVFTDDEVKAIWRAADQLGPIEGGYIKLLVLLAPRKTALAGMRRSELDDANNPTVWTTPHERTKSKKTARKKRVYLTPLPPLAQRILKGLLQSEGEDYLVFPGAHKGMPICPGSPLKRKLVANGAPSDFAFHTMRHTVATWLQNAGHYEYEVGLVLNHSGSGITAGYSHGYPLKPKLFLLAKWASHVAQLVQPEGVRILR
jgi:integrase